jgi:D-xylose transport system substrate-binding protein
MATGRPLFASAATANGRREVPSILVNVIAVDRSNIDDTVVKDGFHQAAALRSPGR